MWDWATQTNLKTSGIYSMPDSARHFRYTDLSKMGPIPSWNMKYVQRDMRKIKVEHKTAVE